MNDGQTPPLTFTAEPEPPYGELHRVSPLLRRMVCRNPSKFTYHGTGTYVIGHQSVAVVDPGPIDQTHLDALLAALDSERVAAVLVTHTHGDHSPAARPLSDATGAPIYAFGPHPRGASSEGESSDLEFVPDIALPHGARLDGPGWTVEALHTPGHMSNHLCFELREEHAVLSGDHIMGWSTSVIPPPDGDIADYLRSLELVRDRNPTTLYPTHGAPVLEPRPYIDALLAHRRDRESQIVTALGSGPKSPLDLVAIMYADTPTKLHEAAARSVISHLRKLRDDGIVVVAATADELDPATRWWSITTKTGE